MFDRLKDIKEWVLATIAVITGLLGFYDVVLKPGNAHRTFIILFIAGNVLLVIGGIEIFRKKVVKRIGLSDVKKPKYPAWLRYAALVIGILVPITSISWFAYKAYKTPPKFVVLVAEFEKEGSQKLGITSAIVDDLKNVKASDIKIVELNTTVTNEDDVIKENNADMLWWGFYENRDNKEKIVVHCKVVNKLMVDNKSMLHKWSMEQNSDDPIFQEKRFTEKFRPEDLFKKVLALEIGYATNYLIGMWHYDLQNYKEAYTDFQAALFRGAVPKQMTQPEDLMFALGLAALKLGKYNEAINFITPYINNNPDDFKAYRYRAEAYKQAGMIDQANSDYQKASEIESRLNKSH